MEPDAPTADGHSSGSAPEGTREPLEDRIVHHLEHDLELVEDEAKHVGVAAARRILPVVGAVLVLAFLAWLLGRRLSDRAARAPECRRIRGSLLEVPRRRERR
jgi:hypothetical protein